MKATSESDQGLAGIFNTVAMFSASQLNYVTIFGLGIMPYISASIIFQLLGSVWGPLERLQKEGESGRKKINEYTRYATVVICIFQSWFYIQNFVINKHLLNPEFDSGMWVFVGVMTMTAGTVFLMWIGEQIDEFGIGNGISLLIMAGILSRMPTALWNFIKNQSTNELGGGGGKHGPEDILVLILLFIGIVAGVVYMTQGQRRIPTQSAKHVRGRRVYGGNRQYLPLRVNQAGVMPIIFASSLLLFPQMIFSYLGGGGNNIWSDMASVFTRYNSIVYNVLYVALIYFFCYFWTAITFNPKDMADNFEEFRNVYSGLPSRTPDRRSSREGHGADHLRRRRIPGDRGDHAHDRQQPHENRSQHGQLLRRHGAVDRRERCLRPGAEDRQPPRDAKLSGLVGVIRVLLLRHYPDLQARDLP